MENKNKPESAELLHCALVVSSEENAEKVFADLFGMSVVKEFMVGEELGRALFGLSDPAKVIVYSAGGATVEAFVCPARAGLKEQYEHICLAVRDRAALIEKAERMGMAATRFQRETDEVVFLRDADGNLYEIKEKQ